MSKRKRYDWSVKRSKPYTATGIKRQSCAKCGEPAEHQWNICADGGLFRPLCKTCDVKLNAMVLAWVGHPDAVEEEAQFLSHSGVLTITQLRDDARALAEADITDLFTALMTPTYLRDTYININGRVSDPKVMVVPLAIERVGGG